MTVKVNRLDAWEEARQALARNLASTLEFLAVEPASADPDSGFQRAQRETDRILAETRKLAVAGLREIDDEIAAGDLVGRIATLSKEARDEAERLKRAIKTIDGIVKAVDKAAGVVTKIAGLPFL